MKKIYNIIFALGLVLVLGSVSLNIYTKHKQNQAKNNFIQNIDKNEKKEENDNDKIKLSDEVALIDIPSVDISSVIVSGVGKDQIRHYIGHFEETAMPGENGNFCIAGHSSTVYNNVFNNLKNIKIDDEIKITTLDGEFTYIVSEIFETEPTNMSVLNQDNNLKEMTIVTCTNSGKDRLIVKGNLK